MHVQLYDYDKTVCPGDTGSAFWLYCLVRRPYILLFLPFQLVGGICYRLGVLEKLHRLCSVHCYMRAINAPSLARRFAKRRLRKVYPYFRSRSRAVPTVVCSASPAFLLEPICAQLGVDTLVATDVDPRTGIVRGRVCKGEEKVRRLQKEYPQYRYDAVYSDSLRHDRPILRLGRTAYLVRSGRAIRISPDTGEPLKD